MTLFKKKIELYKVVLSESILGGEMDQYVSAGCAEEAEEKALESASEYTSKDNLVVKSCQRLGDMEQVNNKEMSFE
jgi:hypothetical protein